MFADALRSALIVVARQWRMNKNAIPRQSVWKEVTKTHRASVAYAAQALAFGKRTRTGREWGKDKRKKALGHRANDEIVNCMHRSTSISQEPMPRAIGVT